MQEDTIQLTLTRNQAAALERLIAEDEADQARRIHETTWLTHPNRKVKSPEGLIPMLIRAPSIESYQKRISEGWTPASDEVIAQHTQFRDVPQQILAAKAKRNAREAEIKAVIAYMGEDEALKNAPVEFQAEIREMIEKSAELKEPRKGDGSNGQSKPTRSRTTNSKADA